MFLFDWFYGILTSLGLRQKEANIMFLGLDNAGKTELLCKLKGEVDAVVYVVDATDLERFTESKRELDALLSDESLANVPVLILANYIISEELFLYHLGLTNFTTGKGKVNLGDTKVRPLEVFMYTLVQVHIDGFEWLSQYIK
ncbi:hypothetical protein Q3G72_012313 [Acer saccharum]|nr:hypothetical protein Q3G72_012313 [Acer saccharum]